MPFGDSLKNLDAGIEMTRIAERGKLDAVFLAGGDGVREMERPALFCAMRRAGGWRRHTGKGPHDDPGSQPRRSGRPRDGS